MSNLVENIKKDLKKANPKNLNYSKIIKKNLSSIVIFIVFLILVSNINAYSNVSFLDRIGSFLGDMEHFSPIPIPLPMNIIQALIGTVVVYFIRKLTKGNRNLKLKDQYGSARWGGETERNYFKNMDNEDDNMILSQTERLRISRNPNIAYERNKNILVIGGSGSGKTRFFVTPNIMQLHSSYVVTDPKGSVIEQVGYMLKKNKYKIKILNLKDLKKSMRYNPFKYIKTESDILKFVNVFMKNTKSEGSSTGDDFWIQAEKLLYTAYIAYIIEVGYDSDKNLVTLSDMINESKVVDDGNGKNPIDYMFEELEAENPKSLAVRQYKKYKSAAGKTAQSIVISCAARLAPIDLAEARHLFSGEDELEIEKIGHEKTFLCIILSDTDSTFNFIAGCFYSQLFDVLFNVADNSEGNELPIHVRCLLDELANTGQIPDFEKIISVIRSRNISASVILQAKSQLKDIYKDKCETIIGNCDTEIFLGGKETSTIKDLSENLGKETIDMYNTSETRSNTISKGLNYQKLGRELMTRDELKTMDGSKCIVEIRGVSPFKSNKFDIKTHKRYNLLREYDKKKNTFDVSNFISKYRNELEYKSILNLIKENTKKSKTSRYNDIGKTLKLSKNSLNNNLKKLINNKLIKEVNKNEYKYVISK